jgi:hypothetical protein
VGCPPKVLGRARAIAPNPVNTTPTKNTMTPKTATNPSTTYLDRKLTELIVAPTPQKKEFEQAAILSIPLTPAMNMRNPIANRKIPIIIAMILMFCSISVEHET